jgi:hypothetical protein
MTREMRGQEKIARASITMVTFRHYCFDEVLLTSFFVGFSDSKVQFSPLYIAASVTIENTAQSLLSQPINGLKSTMLQPINEYNQSFIFFLKAANASVFS